MKTSKRHDGTVEITINHTGEQNYSKPSQAQVEERRFRKELERRLEEKELRGWIEDDFTTD